MVLPWEGHGIGWRRDEGTGSCEEWEACWSYKGGWVPKDTKASHSPILSTASWWEHSSQCDAVSFYGEGSWHGLPPQPLGCWRRELDAHPRASRTSSVTGVSTASLPWLPRVHPSPGSQIRGLPHVQHAGGRDTAAWSLRGRDVVKVSTQRKLHCLSVVFAWCPMSFDPYLLRLIITPPRFPANLAD